MACRCEKRGVDLYLPHIVAYARLALAKFALLHYPQASRTDEIAIRGALTEGVHLSQTSCKNTASGAVILSSIGEQFTMNGRSTRVPVSTALGLL